MNPSTQNTVKSSVAAGLLGIFLGQFGAHDWYLGNKKMGIIHLAIFGGSFVLIILTSIMLAIASLANVSIISVFFGFLAVIAYIAMVGNGIWGFVEGIMLLVQGDAGLAAKGYAVAFPAAANTTTPAASAPTAAPQPTATTTPESKPVESTDSAKTEEPKAEESKATEPKSTETKSEKSDK